MSNFKRLFENCKSNFYNIWNFPNVIDAINRKYICLNFFYIYIKGLEIQEIHSHSRLVYTCQANKLDISEQFFSPVHNLH